MANRFLNQTGLKNLIDKIQSGILTTEIYTGVKGNGNDSTSGSKFFLEAKLISSTLPWILKYRITTEMPNNNNSKQMCDIVIGGVGKELQYYENNNIIYDTAHIGAKNNTFFFSDDKFIIGLDFSNSYASDHNVTIDIQYIKNCPIAFYREPQRLDDIFAGNELNNGVFKLIDFSQFGAFSSAIAQVEGLADVAYSGSYNDLIDKPDLLDVKPDTDNENVIFYIKENE